jgi:hypothetical protein
VRVGNLLRPLSSNGRCFTESLLSNGSTCYNILHNRNFIFWDITPYIPLKVNIRFGGTCRLHLHGRRINQERNQRESGIKQWDVFLRNVAWLLHCVISPKVKHLISTCVRTSNPTFDIIDSVNNNRNSVPINYVVITKRAFGNCIIFSLYLLVDAFPFLSFSALVNVRLSRGKNGAQKETFQQSRLIETNVVRISMCPDLLLPKWHWNEISRYYPFITAAI